MAKDNRSFKARHILDLEHLAKEDIETILDAAIPMKDIILRDIKKVPTLRGKSMVTLFFEPSTRTRTSFELAGKYMGADVVNISANTSSVAKGESLRDTVYTLEAMGVNVIVVRHSAEGSAQYIAGLSKARVINAGDGAHAHPTQGLLDMFTIFQYKKQIEGIKVAIIGDVLHSRVARSNIWGLLKMGAEVHVAGPQTLLPREIERLGVKVHTRVEDAVDQADVINVLRIQLERQQKGLFPTTREYARLFGINQQRVSLAKPDVLLLHPGPMNRGIESAADVAYNDYSAINEQVTNGLAVRMALLYLLMGGAGHEGIA